MRLLDVGTLRIRSFLNENTRPPYAILSHTWLPDGEEVTFEDLLAYHEAVAQGQRVLADSIASRPGFKKIQSCCDMAAQSHGLEWAWIDTCCIDKRSSAELSEAINSMFKWYRDAAACCAFLQDVTASVNDPSFRNSRWFTRGWTLQELIAPKQIWFYDQEWQLIGAKHEDPQLCDIISNITSIPVGFLKGTPLSEACVAKRMSWAAKRQTTRPEDVAYSLLGIFDINMPLLYGEGPKAFIRLQEEIINQVHDQSILAWGDPRIDTPFTTEDILAEPLGALATSPADFEDCGDFEIAISERHDNLDFQVTPSGIKLGANLYVIDPTYVDSFLCEFSCFTWRYPSRRINILLGVGPLAQFSFRHIAQYRRRGRGLWCGFKVSPLEYIAVRWRWRSGYTITIATDATQHGYSCPFSLLQLPEHHTFCTEYVHPSFHVAMDANQLGKCNTLRIEYSPEPVVLPQYSKDWLILQLEIYINVCMFVLGIVNRRTIRACLRITEQASISSPGDAKQIIVIVCYRPLFVQRSLWKTFFIVVMEDKLTCHLVPVAEGRSDDEAIHSTSLGRWLRVYKSLRIGTKTYIKHTRRESRHLWVNSSQSLASLTIIKAVTA